MTWTTGPALPTDFLAQHDWLSTSPESGLEQVPMAERRDASGVDVIRGVVLARVGANAFTAEPITRQSEWFDVLADVFDLRFDATRPSRADAYGTRSSTHTERGRQPSFGDATPASLGATRRADPAGVAWQAIESVGVDGAHVAVQFDVDAVDSPDLALANFLRVCGWAPERAGSLETARRQSAPTVGARGRLGGEGILGP